MLESILIDLKIISKINENDKISSGNIESNIVIENNDLLQGIRRYLNSESREKSVEMIEKILDKSFEYAKNCMNSTFINLYSIKQNPTKHEIEQHFREYTKLKNLSIEISNSKKGLENLKKTYKDDITIVSQIEVLIHKIETNISEIEKKLEVSIVGYNNLVDNSCRNNINNV